ncbi:MAG: NAD-dependent epimerase/dehydratase family protein [Dehalococcoidia bacterium]|nr:NAD-dependent epimerase/dehydratase family protein [Dehalococcoidia bacterium]
MSRILITGSTGFIGGRLAEIAFEAGMTVVGLVRNWSHAARLARLPIELVHGDITHPGSLREAMRGCDVVFHGAVDNRAGGKAHRRSIVQGTANVMQAALEAGVKRVVHLSSVAVYSYKPKADAATEDGAYQYSGDPYCDGKIEAEKIALRYYREHGLPVTVLRPTIVYGPFGSWTVDTVAAIREGHMVLVNGGTGVCNTLYVDNLVEAMLLAGEKDGAAGQVFHISDANPVTWKEFIEAHARALGDSYLPLPQMTAREMAAAKAEAKKSGPSSLEQTLTLMRDPAMRRALRSIPAVERSAQFGRDVARRLLPASTLSTLRQKMLSEGSVSPERRALDGAARRPYLSEAELNIYTIEVVFSPEKARRILSYSPRINFAEGMERTSAWIKWARL